MTSIYITNFLVVSPQIRYIEVFDLTNPPFNEQIWPVPSDFVKSRFHCTTFDKVYLVVAFTGVLRTDGDMSPRSVDRRWSIGVGASIAPRPIAWKRTTIFDRSSSVVQMASRQGVTQVVIATVRIKLVMVDKCLQCLGQLAASGIF